MNQATLDTRSWVRWVGGFIGFPIAGLAAKAVAGPIDSLVAASIGGLVGGAALGLVQCVSRGDRGAQLLRWVFATGVGMAVGLGAGSWVVGYRTDSASLVVMGAFTGAGVGLSQALDLPGATLLRRGVWASGTAALWALGWFITSQVIVDADAQFSNFGSSGALVVAALSGLMHPAILTAKQRESKRSSPNRPPLARIATPRAGASR